MADTETVETVGEDNRETTEGDVSIDGVDEPMEVSAFEPVNTEQPTETENVKQEHIELSSLAAGDTESVGHELQKTIPENVESVEAVQVTSDIEPMQESETPAEPSDEKPADGPASPGNPPLPPELTEPESGSNVDTPASPGFTPVSPGPEQNTSRAEMTASDNDDSNLSNVIVKGDVEEELATPASPTEEESVGVADRVVAHIEQEIAKKLDAESSHGSQSGAATPEDEHAGKRPRSPEHREKKKKRRKERVEEDERTVELEKYWKAVKNNPADFTGWTYLLQYVEQENKMTWAREAFDAFFKQYPYCYGYWKKYADMEKRQGNMEVAAEVYERGLRAIPLSVDLWIHYINFAVSVWEDDEKRIRDLYDRAISASGTDFRSDKLWEQYINWEKDYDLKKVTAIYDRAFTIPTLLYSQHFDNFKVFVKKHHPKDILDLDEFLKLRQEVVEARALTSDKVDELEGPPGGDPDDDAPPGMEPPQAKKTANDDEETLALREKIINGREAIYLENEVEVGKRWALEEGIRRPYFHVKPLERAQLKNWREYLDFEMENGTHERVVVLFERCMIACALYEDFWMKYARYLEKHSIDGVRNVFRRACTIHLPKKPNIHLAWAAFEERNGNTEEAWEILQGIESNLPGLVMLSIRRIGFERRQGNHSEAEHLFQEYIQNAKSTSISTFFATKYARYAFRVMKDKEKAQRILMQAIEKDKLNIKLYLQLLDFEYQSPDPGDEEILRIFDMVLLNDDFPLEQKVAFSRRRVEYLEEFGSNVGSLVEVNEEHQKLIKDHKVEEKKTTKGGERELNQVNTQQHHTGRKRGAEDDAGSSRKRGRGGAHDGSANGGDSQQYNYGNWEGYAGSNQNYNYQQQGYQPYQQYQQYQN